MKKGFTLIELLIVIAIIALLTGIILTSLSGSKAKSRDAKRASDLAQVQLAIEQYFGRCDQYPSVNVFASSLDLTTVNNGCPSGSGVSLATFISKIPTDPTNTVSNGYVYGYATNSATTPTDYVLYAKFETQNAAMPQSAPNPSGTPSWFPSSTFNCTNVAEGGSSSDYNYCVRPN